MLTGPFDSRYRIVSIDPGTDTLGVSLLELDLRTHVISLHSSMTHRGHLLAKQYPILADKHTERFARLMAHRYNLLSIFQQYQPHSIACEAPYMGRFPQAYAALVECCMIVRQACVEYDPSIKPFFYDPPSVKNCVGVGGKNGDKDQMKNAVRNLPNLQNPNGIILEDLDEHSIDSIAVGICRVNDMLKYSRL